MVSRKANFTLNLMVQPLRESAKNLIVADGLTDHAVPLTVDRFALDVTPGGGGRQCRGNRFCADDGL